MGDMSTSYGHGYGDSDVVKQAHCHSPTTKQAWTTEKPKRPKPSLHIDLYNFEDPEFENGKYVLTSPRSLDACSALGIKPVELLHRPLIDIQEELIPRGLPMRTIISAYEQTEKERQNTLALCREERQRLINEQEGVQDGKKLKTTKRVTIKEHLSDSADSGTEVDQEDADDGTLQRQRTAWTTSIGHHRITRLELEQRAQDLHDRALALREATLAISNSKAKLKKKGGAKSKTKAGKNALMVTGKEVKKPRNSRTVTGLRKAPATKTKLR